MLCNMQLVPLFICDVDELTLAPSLVSSPLSLNHLPLALDHSSMLNLCSPASTPINSLPPELLIEIFIYCATQEDLAPLTLRFTCQHWKEVVDKYPRIWRHILFSDETRPITVSHHQAALWAIHSSPLHFDVEIETSNVDNLLPLLSPLLPYSHRWRSLTLTGQREEELDLSEYNLHAQTLRHLNVYLYDWVIDYPEEDDPKVTIQPSPLWPSWYAMNIWLYKLPTANILSPLTFTCISIYEGSFGNFSTQPAAVLDFLKACPALESFYFCGWPHDEDLSNANLPVVSLPRLHTLNLKSTCSTRAYLSHLHTPRLRHLYLAHLNVDFRLQGEYNDPGDSDDEAGDFSQSPWSDQATGMGLRKLIQRSKPPLKVLEMDFSDMRTKDFCYAFSHLPTLEEFRIVASDMSDKVIDLFKATYHEDATVFLRMPRLRQLKLYNCQRLTGDALVRCLASRLIHTDNVTPESTLEDVTIVGCEGVTSHHANMLRRTLRTRLQFVL